MLKPNAAHVNSLGSSLTVSHYLCPPDWSLPRFLDAVVASGFSGVGLTERSLMEAPTASIRQELLDRKLYISSLNSAGFFTWPGEKQHWQDSRNRDLLQWSVELGRAPLNLIVGGSGNLLPTVARARVLKAMTSFIREADGLGVPVMLEPMHPVQFRGKSCINTLAECERMLERFPSLGLTIDLFHTWWDPDLMRILDVYEKRVGVLQISDVAEDVGVPIRVPLDEGRLDWRFILSHALKQNPNKPIELELFMDQLPGRDIREILARADEALQNIEHETGPRLPETNSYSGT